MAERRKVPLTTREMIDDPIRRELIGQFIQRYKFETEKGHIKPVGILGLYAVKSVESGKVSVMAVYDPKVTKNFDVQTIVDTVKQRAVPINEERSLIGYVDPTTREDFEMLVSRGNLSLKLV